MFPMESLRFRDTVGGARTKDHDTVEFDWSGILLPFSGRLTRRKGIRGLAWRRTTS